MPSKFTMGRQIALFAAIIAVTGGAALTYEHMWETFLTWLKTYESIAIWLEGIALVAIFVLDWKQRKDERKDREEQHKETLAQLNVSQAQTNALINSERAWVLVETAELTLTNRGDPIIRPIIKNFGKTVARVTKVSLGGARPLQIGSQLPVPPAYEGGVEDFDFVLCPDRQFPALDAPVVPINRENLDSVRDGLLRMYVFGLIEYRDFSGKERVTGFCLVYDREKMAFCPVVMAPSGYNKAT
jgi:hypothetical protein